jgi:hypothetical protein
MARKCKAVQRHGFGARLERPNAIEALIALARAWYRMSGGADALVIGGSVAVDNGLDQEALNPNGPFPASPALMLTATADEPFFEPTCVRSGHTIIGPTAEGNPLILRNGGTLAPMPRPGVLV